MLKMEEKNSESKRVVQNAFYQSILGIGGSICGLIFTVVVARMLFPEAFGIYSLTLTIILTLVTLSDLGIGTAITRYVSDSLGKKSTSAKKEARSRFMFLLKFKAISSIILSLLLFVFAGLVSTLFKKPDLVLPLQIGAVYMLILSIYGIISPLFLALEKVKYSTFAGLILEFSRVVLIFVFLYFYKNVAAVFIVLSIALLLAMIYSFFVISKKYKFLLYGKIKPVERRRLLLFSGFLALNSLNAVIFTNIDKLILGYFPIDIKFIGFYTAIFTVISGVTGLLGVGGVIFPVFVHSHGEKLKLAFKKTFHYLFLFTFPVTVGLAYTFVFFLKLLYGAAYVPVEYQLTIFITSIFLSTLVLEGILTSLYSTLFNAKEKPKWPSFDHGICCSP